MRKALFEKRQSNVKLIAMIDLLAFLLLITTYLLLSNPDEEDLNDILNRNVNLSLTNAELAKELLKERAKLEALQTRQDQLRLQLENLIAANSKSETTLKLLINSVLKYLPDLQQSYQHHLAESKAASTDIYRQADALINAIEEDSTKRAEAALGGAGGNFITAGISFSAGDFRSYPVDTLLDEVAATLKIVRVLDYHSQIKQRFPYIFVIGHANTLDEIGIRKSEEDVRQTKNYVWATRRAALIASLLGRKGADMNNVVVVSTGEFDLKYHESPGSTGNAWVEIVFGRHWKIPANRASIK